MEKFEIPEESQVALTLKTLCGLSTSEIAKAFWRVTERSIKRSIGPGKDPVKKNTTLGTNYRKVAGKARQGFEITVYIVQRRIGNTFACFMKNFKSYNQDQLSL